METTRQQDLRQLLHQQQLISQQLAQLMQAEAAAGTAGTTIPTEAEFQRMPDPPQAVLDEVHRARPPTEATPPTPADLVNQLYAPLQASVPPWMPQPTPQLTQSQPTSMQQVLYRRHPHQGHNHGQVFEKEN